MGLTNDPGLYDKDPVDNQSRLRTQVKGATSTTGQAIAGKSTDVQLNSSTWTPLPATPLANRNGISIQNRSGIEIKTNYQITNIETEVPGYTGTIVPDGDSRAIDMAASIIIYGKSLSGTPTVNIEELS